MYKPVFLSVVLLFVFPLDQVQAQARPSKPQPPTNTTSQMDSKVTPGQTEPTAEAKSLYEDGIERLEMGQISEAVERFQQALKIDPEYVEAYSALGRSFFKLRQWDNAARVLRRGIDLKGKQRERQDPLPKNDVRGITPGMVPASPTSKPQVTNRTNADSTPRSISVISAQPVQRTSPKSIVATPPPTLNKPLPTFRINTTIAQTTLDSVLKPTQVRLSANIKSENILGNPPPVVSRVADAVQPPAIPSEMVRPNQQKDAGAAVQNASELNRNVTNASATKQEPVGVQIARNVTPSSPLVVATSVSAASPNSSADEIALTNIYRVGSKDVLDIRLSNSQPQQTTAFTVTQSGLLEHPNLSEPLSVSGLTVEEIRTRIEANLKNHAVMEDPKVFVGVLEHVSHTILVDGLVKEPGTKLLKSEAVLLALVLAEAQPLFQAARVTVVRNGLDILETELSQTADMGFLVHPGDVVTLHPQVNESIYVGGKVRFPGEMTYRVGLTLMQAIITAGGSTSNSKVAEIARDGEQVPARFDLEAIESGKAADPVVKPRDRIILH